MNIRNDDPDAIYSPEASDTDPRGDWQTRLGIAIEALMMIAAVVAWWAWGGPVPGMQAVFNGLAVISFAGFVFATAAVISWARHS